MSQQHWGVDVTFEAGEDLSAARYLAMTLGSSDGTVVKAGATDQAIGILQNAPESGQAARVRMFGTTKAVAGAAITRGALVAVDANGKVQAATAIDDTWNGTVVRVLGIALESASAADEVIEIMLCPHTYGT